jgi:GPH family glycoside/pentoside/hexuronide:cation symporter
MTFQKLRLKEKIGYGFGDAASSMFWKLFGMYIMFFYTDIYGIPAAIVGTMFLLTRVGDAVIDPFIGIMADRTETRWGKFRPYLLWMAIPFGIIGVLTFTTPNLGMTGKIVYAYVTYSLMMIIYSMINVPYASLMGVMTSDGKERTTLATFRFIFAFGGSFLVLALFQPLFDGFGTKTVSNYSEPKLVQLNDSTQKTNAKLYVWNGQVTSELKEKPVDSLLFVSAKLITKSKDAFKIGVLNTKTNEYSWVNFSAGKDTLGLLRDGSTSKVLIKLSSIVSKKALANPENFKVVYSTESNSVVKFTKVDIKQVDYKTGFQYAVIVIAVMAVLLFLLTFSWTRERVKPITEKTKLKDDLKDLSKNMPWFILLGASVSTIFFNTIRDGAAVYYFLYYFKGESSIELTATTALAISTIYLLLGQAANIIGVVLAKPVSDRIGKKYTFLIAMLFATVLSVCFFFLNKSNLYGILGFQFLISINAGIIFPLVWSMYADTADYSEWRNKRRATGLVFSAASMSQKFGASLGIAAVGWIMALYHYIPNVEQAVSTQNGFRMMLSVFPAVGAILAALFMVIYPLTEKKMKEIATDLAVQREIK